MWAFNFCQNENLPMDSFPVMSRGQVTSFQYEWKKKSKYDHVIYRWKAPVTLILNHMWTWVWEWSPSKIFRLEVGHVTKFKPKYHPRPSFPEYSSYVILNQRNNSFPIVYNMTIFGRKKMFVHSEMTSRDQVTLQENCPWEDFHFGKNWKPTPCGLQKSKNLRWLFSLILNTFPPHRER